MNENNSLFSKKKIKIRSIEEHHDRNRILSINLELIYFTEGRLHVYKSSLWHSNSCFANVYVLYRLYKFSNINSIMLIMSAANKCEDNRSQN